MFSATLTRRTGGESTVPRRAGTTVCARARCFSFRRGRGRTEFETRTLSLLLFRFNRATRDPGVNNNNRGHVTFGTTCEAGRARNATIFRVKSVPFAPPNVSAGQQRAGPATPPINLRRLAGGPRESGRRTVIADQRIRNI